MEATAKEIAHRIALLARDNPSGARLEVLVERELERFDRLDNYVRISIRQAVAGIREARDWLSVQEPAEAMRLLVPAAMRVGFALTMRPRSASLRRLRNYIESFAVHLAREAHGAAA